MHTKAWKPRRRSSELIIQSLDGELLVYDTVEHQAHCPHPAADLVLELCTGEHTVEQIAVAAALEAESVNVILGELERARLLDSGGLSRRQALVAGASMAAFVTTILVPRAAAAASCLHSGASCAAGFCCGGLLCVRVGPIKLCISG